MRTDIIQRLLPYSLYHTFRADAILSWVWITREPENCFVFKM